MNLKTFLTSFKRWSIFFLFTPQLLLAQSFGNADLSGKMNTLTSNLMGVVLPAVSTLGLLYAAMLAASGDEGAKRRMTTVAWCSAIGFLAPVLINWLKGFMN